MDWPGEKLVIQLFKTVEKSIGGALKPSQIRRVASAEARAAREQMLLLAQTECDAALIKAGKKRLTIDGELQDRVVWEKLEWEQKAREIEKEINIVKAVLMAEEELRESSGEVPEREVDRDWASRWREYAGMISAEQLQQLWAQLLAGEVKSPGTFSLRTLEFVRNLSTEEATEIARLSTFVVDDAWIPYVTLDELATEGIITDNLLRMAELGVINPASVGITPLERHFASQDPNRFRVYLLSHDKCLLVSHEDATKTLSLSGIMLTAIGQQIMKLGSFKTNQRYLERIGWHIINEGFEVSIADFVRQPKNEGMRGRWCQSRLLNQVAREAPRGIPRLEIMVDGLHDGESAEFKVDTFTGYSYTQKIENAIAMEVTIPNFLIGLFVAVLLQDNVKWEPAKIEWKSFGHEQEKVVAAKRRDGGVLSMRVRTRIDAMSE